MLNRRHIRVKVMQALYSYWSSGDSLSKLEVEREMYKNMKKLYELYLYLLLFVRELQHFIEQYDDEVKTRYIPSAKQINANLKFYTNPLSEQLRESEQLNEAIEEYKLVWDQDQLDILRKIFLDLKNTEEYKEYIGTDKDDIYSHYAILNFIVKHYPANSSLLDSHLEEKFMNWFDDEKLVLQMVVKSLKKLAEEPDKDDFLIPMTTDEEMSFDFAKNLLLKTIKQNNEYVELIKNKIEKWEPSRIPLLDAIILKMGVSEFLYFPSIPVKVTINESIELAKNYSTPNSKKFINGVLDNILIDLEKQGRIKKSGLGLIDS